MVWALTANQELGRVTVHRGVGDNCKTQERFTNRSRSITNLDLTRLSVKFI
jgi:hypothetical protein